VSGGDFVFSTPNPEATALQTTALQAAALLQELVDNGRAERLEGESEGRVRISPETLVGLDAAERAALGLPELFSRPSTLRVDRNGDLHEPGFRFEYALLGPSGERGVLQHKVMARIGETSWLLSEAQFNICREIDEFNAQADSEGASDLASVLLTLARVQDFARADKDASDLSAVALEPLLAGTRVDAPEFLGLSLEAGEDEIVVGASLPDTDIDQKRFADTVAKWRKPKGLYTEEMDDGDRRRIVFAPRQQAELSRFKKRSYRGEDMEKLLEAPQEFFDPDVVDLDSFSDRVREIGRVKAKYYPFIFPYKSDWFAEGLKIEQPSGEYVQTVVHDEKDLAVLEKAIEQAEETGAEKVSLPEMGQDGTPTGREVEVPLAEAKSLYSRARTRLTRAKGDADGELGLIIDENVEELGYAVESSGGGKILKYRLEETPRLDKSYGLLPHQEEGIAWMQELARSRDGSFGALLADDMGLGKTLQVLSFLEWYGEKMNAGDRPCLIAAPVALLENWEREYRRFFPNGAFYIIRAYGSEPVSEDLCPRRLVLTTYETLRKRQLDFCRIDWAVAVLDEAQKIKTPGILVSTAAKALKAEVRIAMTGTPVENTLLDLWSIMDYAMPGLLDSAKNFARRYQKEYPTQEAIAAVGEELKEKLGIFFKRRLKEDILKELPEKTLCFREQSMPTEQLSVYEGLLADFQKIKATKSFSKPYAIEFLHRLKDASDHPFLITHSETELIHISADDLIATSAKLKALAGILEDVRQKREKVILFAPRKPVQRILQRVACSILGLSPAEVPIVNGETPSYRESERGRAETRQEAIDRFQAGSGTGVIVLSPLAAGFGLNITEANHVVHYSRHWNPAKENQATDRAHRIGQKKPVFVYFPMAVSEKFKTFDVIIHERLENKRALARGALFPVEQMEVTPIEILESLPNPEDPYSK
jgi:hypothetical protein